MGLLSGHRSLMQKSSPLPNAQGTSSLWWPSCCGVLAKSWRGATDGCMIWHTQRQHGLPSKGSFSLFVWCTSLLVKCSAWWDPLRPWGHASQQTQNKDDLSSWCAHMGVGNNQNILRNMFKTPAEVGRARWSAFMSVKGLREDDAPCYWSHDDAIYSTQPMRLCLCLLS